jgi:hypothetical protein
MDADLYDRAAFLSRLPAFSGLDEASILKISAKFSEKWFDPGTLIYKQGTRENRLYILHFGSVKLLQISDGTSVEETRAILEEDDVFGFEAVEDDPFRLLTAVAVRGSSVLSIDQISLQAVLDDYPLIARRLQLLADSYHLWVDNPLPWNSPEESMVYMTRRHPIFLWLGIAIPLGLFGVICIPFLGLYFFIGYINSLFLILLGSVLAICLGWAVWRAIDWSNDYYIITRRRIVYQQRVLLLYDSRQEVPLEAIISSSSYTSQIGRIIGYGNVVIRSFIGTLEMNRIANPEYLMLMINFQRQHAQTSVHRMEYESMKQFWRKVRSPTKEKPTIARSPQGNPPQAQYAPGVLQVSLANILHLNVEQNGNLIFRTHWFILLKQIAPPTLSMLALLILVLLRIFNWFDFISMGAFLFLMALIALIVAGWWIYQFVDWTNDVCIVTDDQVIDIDRTPLGSEEKRAAPLKAILSIDYERLGIIGLVLNYGSVNVRTGGDTMTIQYVYNPSEVARMIFERYERFKWREKKNEQEMGWRNTSDFIRAYEESKNEGEIPPPESVSG